MLKASVLCCLTDEQSHREVIDLEGVIPGYTWRRRSPQPGNNQRQEILPPCQATLNKNMKIEKHIIDDCFIKPKILIQTGLLCINHFMFKTFCTILQCVFRNFYITA